MAFRGAICNLKLPVICVVWWAVTLSVIGALIVAIGDASDQAEHNSKLIEAHTVSP